MKNLHNINPVLSEIQYAILWAHRDLRIQTVSLLYNNIKFSSALCSAFELHRIDWATQGKPTIDISAHYRIESQ